jgi:hypothetical protein
LVNFGFDSAMLARSASTMDFSAKRTHAKARIIKLATGRALLKKTPEKKNLVNSRGKS